MQGDGIKYEGKFWRDVTRYMIDNARVMVGKAEDSDEHVAYDPGGMFYLKFSSMPTLEQVEAEIALCGYEAESY